MYEKEYKDDYFGTCLVELVVVLAVWGLIVWGLTKIF